MYATPNIATLMTCLIKSKETKHLVSLVWDLMLDDGIFFVFSILIYLLDLQKAHIDQIKVEDLPSTMQHVDGDPFAVIRESGLNTQALESCLKHLSKDNLSRIDYDWRVFERMEYFYKHVEQSVQRVFK